MITPDNLIQAGFTPIYGGFRKLKDKLCFDVFEANSEWILMPDSVDMRFVVVRSMEQLNKLI